MNPPPVEHSGPSVYIASESSRPSVAPEARLRTLDFLRGIAIVGVIAVHSSQDFPSGHSSVDFAFGTGRFGVQLFFFVSAITMCYMSTRRIGERSPIANFYLRRAFRIAPLFWLAIPIYLYINGRGPSYWAPNGVTTSQVVLTALFLHGMWPDSLNSVVPGGWSISVEMTFYLIFPWLFRAIGNRRSIYVLLAVVVWVLYTLALRNLVSREFLLRHDSIDPTLLREFLTLNFLNQLPIFLLGCFIYFASIDKPTLREAILLGSWIAFATVAQIFLTVEGFGFFCAYIGIGVLVYVSVIFNARLRPLELLGKNSYSIYLTHFLVLLFLKPLLPMDRSAPALLAAFATTIFLSYALSVGIHLLVEKHIYSFVASITDPKRSRFGPATKR